MLSNFYWIDIVELIPVFLEAETGGIILKWIQSTLSFQLISQLFVLSGSYFQMNDSQCVYIRRSLQVNNTRIDSAPWRDAVSSVKLHYENIET